MEVQTNIDVTRDDDPDQTARALLCLVHDWRKWRKHGNAIERQLEALAARYGIKLAA